MRIVLDTNILLDILLPDPKYKNKWLSLVTEYSRTTRLIISELVYAELASQFFEIDLLNMFLHDFYIILKNTSPEGLWYAARAWNKHINNRDDTLQCNYCGACHYYG